MLEKCDLHVNFVSCHNSDIVLTLRRYFGPLNNDENAKDFEDT